jgi:hypothetical protein
VEEVLCPAPFFECVPGLAARHAVKTIAFPVSSACQNEPVVTRERNALNVCLVLQLVKNGVAARDVLAVAVFETDDTRNLLFATKGNVIQGTT